MSDVLVLLGMVLLVAGAYALGGLGIALIVAGAELFVLGLAFSDGKGLPWRS